jgi:hypothetical protein
MVKVKPVPFRLLTARRITDTRASCYADPRLFEEWDTLSKDAKLEFIKNGPVPCEGGGTPGQWCDSCRFGHVDAPDDV